MGGLGVRLGVSLGMPLGLGVELVRLLEIGLGLGVGQVDLVTLELLRASGWGLVEVPGSWRSSCRRPQEGPRLLRAARHRRMAPACVVNYLVKFLVGVCGALQG